MWIFKKKTSNEIRDIAEAILQEAFGIHRLAWWDVLFDTELIELHFFTELHEISISCNDLSNQPEAKRLIETFQMEFIRKKAKEAAKNNNYIPCRIEFHKLLKAQPKRDRLHIMRYAIYEMHKVLMKRDFGSFFDSFDSDCQDLTKEAEEFYAARGKI